MRQALCMDTDQMVQKVLEELRENATASEGGSIYDERDRALQDIEHSLNPRKYRAKY